MPRDGRTIAKYVLAGLALVAMLARPFFIASGLMAPGWAVVTFIAVWLALFLLGCFDKAQAVVGRAAAVPCGRNLVWRHECRWSVARLDALTSGDSSAHRRAQSLSLASEDANTGPAGPCNAEEGRP